MLLAPFVVAMLTMVAGASGAGVRTSQISVDQVDFALFAVQRLVVGEDADVASGLVGTNGALTIAELASVQGTGFGSDVTLGERARILGDLHYNRLRLGEGASIAGTATTPLPLPVLTLPPTPSIVPGSSNVTVPPGASATLVPGAYRVVTVRERGRLVVSGGSYRIDKLIVGERASLLFGAPSTLDVRSQVTIGERALFDVATSLAPSDVELRSAATRITVGRSALLAFHLLAPTARVTLGERTIVRGHVLAREIMAGSRSLVSLEESFSVKTDPEQIVTAAGRTLVGNRLLLDLVDSARFGIAKDLATSMGGTIVGHISGPNIYAVEVLASSLTELDAILASLEAAGNPLVEVVGHINVPPIGGQTATTPLTDLFQRPPPEIVPYSDIRLREAWTLLANHLADGRFQNSIALGLVDTPIETSHDEFRRYDVGFIQPISQPGIALRCLNSFGVPVTGYAVGHGTSVLGVMAAHNTGLPLSGSPEMNGVATGLQGALLRVETGNLSEEELPTLYEIHRVARSGALVVNLSFGGLRLDVRDAQRDTALMRGIVRTYPNTLFVVAAGNDGVDVKDTFPGNLGEEPNVLVVGAAETDETGRYRRADFGPRTHPCINYDALIDGSNFGVGVEIAAPGKGVYAPTSGGRYGFLDGTSLAAPLVAGAAVLLRAARPDLPAAEVADLLIDSAVSLAPDPGDDTRLGCPDRYPAARGCLLDVAEAIRRLLLLPLPPQMSGYFEVPSVSSPATASLEAQIDGATIRYTLTYSGLSSTASAAHIHFAQPGVNGGIVAFLCGGGDKPACPATSGSVSGTIDAADILGISAQGIAAGDIANVIAAMQAGFTYFNVHTASFPNGEVRGQIEPLVPAADASGYFEVPSISTTGRGTIEARINNTTSIDFKLTYSGLSGNPTAAHIHFAQPGVIGGVVAFLCGGGGKPACPAGPGSVSGTIGAADVLAVAGQGIAAGEIAEVIAAVQTGFTYANVHTAAYPGGEIRGQIEPLVSAPSASGYFEVPSVSSPATASLEAQIDGATIRYTLTYSGLSSTASAAHIHFAQPGVNGGIVAFLCGGGDKPACPATSGSVSGTIDAADILGISAQGIAAGDIANVIAAMQAGFTYFNVHTASFPNGEIRGQIEPVVP